jgi:hypothetical protein
MSRTLRISIFSGLYFVCRLLLSLWWSSHWFRFGLDGNFFFPIAESIAFGSIFDLVTQYLWRGREGESKS